nr:aspartate dehydrogenase [Lachnospiraceae bacterium]
MKKLSALFKKSSPATSYDPSLLRPVILSSICTGEKTAGFQEIATGKFREVMLVKNEADVQKFREQYGIEGEIKTIY